MAPRDGYLILDGEEVAVPFEVRHDERWHFKAARRRRTKPLQFGVLHHQGGEGSASTVWRVLRKRGYSVHFQIDRHGVVTQYTDPVRFVTFHAGKANELSWGVEIANRARPPGSRGIVREAYEDELHGRPIPLLRFYEAQVWAAYQLCRAMEKHLELPIRFPMEGGDGHARVLRGVFPGWPEWRGLLCHFHLTDRKIDPVPHLADDLVRLPDVQS